MPHDETPTRLRDIGPRRVHVADQYFSPAGGYGGEWVPVYLCEAEWQALRDGVHYYGTHRFVTRKGEGPGQYHLDAWRVGT